MFFLLFVFYHSKKDGSFARIDRYYRSFGFLPNATFNFTVLANVSDQTTIILGLLTENEHSYTFSVDYDLDMICSGNMSFGEINSTQRFRNHRISWVGKIRTQKVLHPVFMSCHNDTFDFTSILDFQNIKSCLDYRRIPMLKSKFYVVGGYGVMLIVSLYNYIYFYKHGKPLHLMITLSLMISIASSILSYFRLKHENTTDQLASIQYISEAFSFVGNVIMFTTMILAARGWGLLSEKISLKNVVRTILVTMVFFSLITYSQYADVHLFQVVLTFIILVLIVVLLRLVVFSINEAELLILAHLYVISQSGIDPSSTPVYKKHHIYQVYQNSVISYFTVSILKLISVLFLELDFWVADLIEEISNIMMYFVLIWCFRIRRVDTNGYSLIGKAGRVLTMNDLENISVDDRQIHNHDLLQWEDGMTLPPPPDLLYVCEDDTVQIDSDTLSLEDNLTPLDQDMTGSKISTAH